MRNKKLIIVFAVIVALALLIVLTSVIFSVRHIDTYCYNVDTKDITDEEISDIIDSSGIKTGRSIFTLSVSEAANKIEKEIPGIDVINIERIFPNRISINYVRISPYLEIEQDGTFYQCSNDGKIVSSSDTSEGNLIELVLGVPLSAPAPGQGMASADPSEINAVKDVIAALARLGYRNEMVELIGKIDTSREAAMFILMKSGAVIQVLGRSNIYEKVDLAMTLYVRYDQYKLSGTITVYQRSDGTVAAAHSTTNLYTNP